MDKLHYRSGPLRGELRVEDIRAITIGKTMWAGVKPALATNGLIIKYSRSSELYIAPESNSAMVQDLLAINPKIRVVTDS